MKFDYLFEVMEKSKDITFIKNEKGESATYEDTLNYCDKLKDVISERCFVLILTKNTIGGVLNYLGCVKNRIVPLLINSITDEKLVAGLIKLYKPRYIFVPSEMRDKYSNYESVFDEYGYNVFRTDYDEKEELDDNLCMCMTTSGSTGGEKIVRLSYDNIATNTKQEWDFFLQNQKKFGNKFERGDFRTIVSLPICYSFMILVINMTILGGGVAGGTILITEKHLFEEEFWKFFFMAKSNALYGIPYHAQMLDKIGFFEKEYPFFSQMVIAGGHLTDELYDKCIKFSERNNSIFGIAYGQCEATAGISQLEYDMVSIKRDSIGKGMPDMKLYLVDDDDNVITEPNVAGELVCEGANVALGYANSRADLAKGDEFKGKIHTGDIAICDEDGYFFIRGRKKRFVKVYGNSVNLDDVDGLIRKKFKDLDCCCIGTDDNITIFVDDDKCIDDIVSYIASTLNFNKQVFKVRYTDKILRNDSGKIFYSKMMEL